MTLSITNLSISASNFVNCPLLIIEAATCLCISKLVNAVGTGWKLETYSKNNEIIETVYLSVFGDVNGDGRITASDVSYLRQLASDADLFTSLDMHKQVAASIINCTY